MYDATLGLREEILDLVLLHYKEWIQTTCRLRSSIPRERWCKYASNHFNKRVNAYKRALHMY